MGDAARFLGYVWALIVDVWWLGIGRPERTAPVDGARGGEVSVMRVLAGADVATNTQDVVAHG